MRLGIPDDYAEAFLADILTRFNHRHPLVEIAATCENSIELAALVHAGALELALVTDHEGLERLRADPRGAAGLGGVAAIQGRGRASRSRWRWAVPPAYGARSPTRRWRVGGTRVRAVFVSKNYTAIGSVVRAGPRRDRAAGGHDRRRPAAARAGMGASAPAADPHGTDPPGRQSSEEARALAEAIRATIGEAERVAA